MKLMLPVLFLLALPGCDFLNNIDDYLTAVAGESLYLSVQAAAPEGQLDIPVDDGVGALVFAAAAETTGQISGAPLTGATVDVAGPFGSVALPDLGDGVYSANSMDEASLSYSPGSSYTFTLVAAGETEGRTMEVVAPPYPNISWPPFQQPLDLVTVQNQGYLVDLTGQGYDNAVVLVVNQDGNLTYDNRPDNVSEYMDWLRDSEVTEVLIPGSAFPAAGPYAVGVAGLDKALDPAFDGLNPLVSNAFAGAMQMTLIQVQ